MEPAGSSSVNVLDDYKKAACGENAEAGGNKSKDDGKEERTSQKADICFNRRKRQSRSRSQFPQKWYHQLALGNDHFLTCLGCILKNTCGLRMKYLKRFISLSMNGMFLET
jgi:hypothetical protein